MPPLERYQHLISESRAELSEKALARFADQPELLQIIRQHHLDFTWPEIPDLDPDAALYQVGLFSDQELALSAELHAAKPEQKSAVAQRFPQANSRTLARRLVARNHPDAADPDDLALLAEHISRIQNDPSLTDHRGNRHRTPEAALAEISELQQSSLQPEQQSLLTELRSYLQNNF